MSSNDQEIFYVVSKCGSEPVESVPPKAVSMVVRSLLECRPRSAVCPGAVQCFVRSEEMPYAPVAIPNRLNLPCSQSIFQFGISHCSPEQGSVLGQASELKEVQGSNRLLECRETVSVCPSVTPTPQLWEWVAHQCWHPSHSQ